MIVDNTNTTQRNVIITQTINIHRPCSVKLSYVITAPQHGYVIIFVYGKQCLLFCNKENMDYFHNPYGGVKKES